MLSVPPSWQVSEITFFHLKRSLSEVAIIALPRTSYKVGALVRMNSLPSLLCLGRSFRAPVKIKALLEPAHSCNE